jgi:hypothetical protein
MPTFQSLRAEASGAAAKAATNRAQASARRWVERMRIPFRIMARMLRSNG